MNTIEDYCLTYCKDIETRGEDVVVSIVWELSEWDKKLKLMKVVGRN